MVYNVKGKIGLALGGGGAKGLAHIGVLKVLEEEKIPIQMIAGTSMGAVIGAIYATGKDSKQLEELALNTDLKETLRWIDPCFPKMGFIKGKKINDLLKSLIGEIKFTDLKIPFACVATDIKSGEEVVIKTGSVVGGIRASISGPGVFPPVKWEERFLIDGGLVNPVPISVLKEMGADFIIAVNVESRGEESGPEKVKRSKELNLFTIIKQSFLIAIDRFKRSGLKEADLIIEPCLKHVREIDFYRAKECISQGEAAARDSLLKIKKCLKARVK